MENKLPIDLKTKWIEALRSGEYKQGKHSLQKEDKFCCLGVLCKVMDLPTEDYDVDSDEPYPKEWIGRSKKIPEFLQGETDITEALSLMNDGDKNQSALSFNEIADYIEEEL